MIICCQKDGLVERMSSPYEVIVKNLLKKESNVQPFVNLAVSFSTGENGIIEGHFGQSGKVKIRIRGNNNLMNNLEGLTLTFSSQLPRWTK